MVHSVKYKVGDKLRFINYKSDGPYYIPGRIYTIKRIDSEHRIWLNNSKDSYLVSFSEELLETVFKLLKGARTKLGKILYEI